MATEEVLVANVPNPSVNWTPVSPIQIEIQNLGMFAVKEQKEYGNLTFNAVYESWKTFDNLYLLYIKVIDTKGYLKSYEAVVWAGSLPEGYGGPEPRALLYFKELLYEA